MLESHGIRKRYGKREALRGVDLVVEAGEFFGLLGPNGAGKSTFLKIVSGFLQADDGRLFINGHEVSGGGKETGGMLGLVPQEIAVYERLNALENLGIFGGLYGLKGPLLRERSETLLRQTGLWERRSEPVGTFSGGMKRRLNIAAALLHEPRILLCDEPTVGVDPQSRNAIFSFLEACNRDGLTVIYTTHYLEEAERLCRRIGIIDHGQLPACGTLDELLRQTGVGPHVKLDGALVVDPVMEVASGMGQLEKHGDGYRLELAADARLSRLYAAVEAAGLPSGHITVRKPSLEDVFLHLTGHALRDHGEGIGV